MNNSERLICAACSKAWSRTLSRGRKPKFCPSCTQDQDNSFDTHTYVPSNVETTSSSLRYSGRNKWLCPSCSISLETFIGMDTEPMHKCEKRARKWSALQKIS